MTLSFTLHQETYRSGFYTVTAIYHMCISLWCSWSVSHCPPAELIKRGHLTSLTFEDLRSARARQRSCRCPTENDILDSFRWISSPPAASTSSLTWHLSKAFQMFISSHSRNGSRLSLQILNKGRANWLIIESNWCDQKVNVTWLYHKAKYTTTTLTYQFSTSMILQIKMESEEQQRNVHEDPW